MVYTRNRSNTVESHVSAYEYDSDYQPSDCEHDDDREWEEAGLVDENKTTTNMKKTSTTNPKTTRSRKATDRKITMNGKSIVVTINTKK
jgi:hypothetical protein